MNKKTATAPKISILVPIFNVAEFLDECLSSIKKQTLKDIEIICINDGSTDNSLEIIKSYAKDDDRFVIVDKKNSGYGDSMNQGLKKATGDFIGIVESDDSIKPDMYENLYKLASKNEAQVAKGNAIWYWASNNKAVETNLVDEDNINKVINPSEKTGIFYKIPSIWAAIYRRDFIEKNKIKFSPTPGASYQDTGFSYKVWAMAERVIFTDKAYLYYRQDNSASSMNNIATKAPILFGEFISIEEYLKKNNKEDLIPLIREREFVSLYNFLVHTTGEASVEFMKKIRERFDGVDIEDSLFENKKMKVLYKTISVSPKLYFFSVRAKRILGRIKQIIIRIIPPLHRSREIKWLEKELSDRIESPAPVRELKKIKIKAHPAISIIVPIYNSEKYLEQCLESLKSQTYKNIEIVCVDDHSSDKSSDIFNRVSKKDDRFKLVRNVGKGISDARNTGLRNATAPYIMWCDSDDYFDKDMCEIMLQTILSDESDIAECATNIMYSDDFDENLKQGVDRYLRPKLANKNKMNDWIIITSNASLWNKIYKKEIIDKNKIEFPSGLLYEDAFFNDIYMVNSNKISFISKKLYNYRRHNDSIMSKSFKKTGIAKDYQDISEKLYDYLIDNYLYEGHEDLFWERFCRYNSFAFNNVRSDERIAVKARAVQFTIDNKDKIAKLDKNIQRNISKTLFFSGSIPSAIKSIIKKIYYSDPTRKGQISKIESLHNKIVETF